MVKTGKDTKLVLFTVIDGKDKQIHELAKALASLKHKLPEDIEFLVCNDKYQLVTVRHMIEQLYILYKREGKILDSKLKRLEEGKKELLKIKNEKSKTKT